MKDNRYPVLTCRQSSGFSSVETIVALLATSVLMTGLASALFIASRSLETAQSRHSGSAADPLALLQLQDDLNEALAIEESSGGLLLTLPDRNQDSALDQRLYWLEDSTLLVSQENVPDRILLKNLNQVGLRSATINHPPSHAHAASSPSLIQYRGCNTATATNVTEIPIPLPPGTTDGDFIVIVAAISNSTGQAQSDLDWTREITQRSSNYRLLFWHHFQQPGDPLMMVMSWQQPANAVAGSLRFTGVRSNNSIGDSDSDGGTHSPTLLQPGPLATPLTADLVNSVVIQGIVVQNPRLQNYRSGLPAYADLIQLRHQDLELACSLRFLHELTGSIDQSSRWRFTASSVYVTGGVVLCADM